MIDPARTIDEATPHERQRIYGLLDRCGLSIVDSPPDGMGVVYVTFLPWRPHGRRWAYLGRSKSWCLRYLGSGKAITPAKRAHARGDFIKVCVGAAENGPPLIELEEALQIKAGVRRTREDPMHRDWLNVLASGGGGHQNATKEQMQRGGKIGGKIGGKMLAERFRTDPEYRAKQQAVRSANGPAAAANMSRQRVDLRSSHDPDFLPSFGLPSIPKPPGGRKHLDANRCGHDIADDAIIVGVGVPVAHGNSRSGSKGNLAKAAIYDRPFVTFAQHVADRARLYPGDRAYGTASGANRALSRDSIWGLFSIVCPTTGRVLRGPGSDQERLTFTRDRGWMRGRVRSLGPYSHLRLAGGPI